MHDLNVVNPKKNQLPCVKSVRAEYIEPERILGAPPSQRLAVERDYGMEDGRHLCKVKAALLPYLLLAMRLGADDFQREAMSQQIVLLNREALQAFIAF